MKRSDFEGSGGGGNYLKASDLEGKRIPAKIERIEKEEMPKFDSEEMIINPVLYFVGKGKGAVISGVQKWDALEAILGPDMDDWPGKVLVLTTRQTGVGPGVWFESAKTDEDVPFTVTAIPLLGLLVNQLV